MGLLKGSWSFLRYRVDGKLPDMFDEFIDHQIKKNAFNDMVNQFAEKIMGWTSLVDPLDTDFKYAEYKCGPYLIFTLRVDRKTLPSSLVKIKIKEAEQRYLTENGKKKLYRHERAEIKERVCLELQGKAFSIPSFYEICWSVQKQVIFFGSLSSKNMEDFEKYFKESFQLSARPLIPWEALTEEGNDQYLIGQGEPSTVNGKESQMDNAMHPSSWGREFLTWLWFKSEARNGRINTSDIDENEVLFLHRLVLAAGDGEYSETVICQGLHSDMQEGKEALRLGKKIKEANLRLSKDSSKWEFSFKADQFHFQSVKLPSTINTDDESDRDGQHLERIYLVEKVAEIMDQLFLAFFQLRLSPLWAKEEYPQMVKWLQQQ